MTFQDIFKKAFLESAGSISIVEALLSTLVALALGLLIFLTYRYTFSGVMYSKNFSLSLVAVTTITSVIVVTLASNIVLSLGMVGALSIVRFRTAIKEPLDVVYMFWSITIGIVCGAALYWYALLATLIVGGLFFLMNRFKDHYTKYVVIINYDKSAYEAVQEILSKTTYILRSRTVTNNDMELVIEIDAKAEKSMFVNRLSELESVTNVSLVNYRSGI
jgi:uncharacterized membrane protein YhiD involved in acid resistance